MKRTNASLWLKLTSFLFLSLQLTACGASGIAGKFYDEKNPAQYLELKPDHTFYVSTEGGGGLTGTYELSGEEITLNLQVMGTGTAVKGKVEKVKSGDRVTMDWPNPVYSRPDTHTYLQPSQAEISRIAKAKQGALAEYASRNNLIPSSEYPLAGFWQIQCSDIYGHAIAPAGNQTYSVSLIACGTKSCTQVASLRNSSIVNDPDYHVIDNDTIELKTTNEPTRWRRCHMPTEAQPATTPSASAATTISNTPEVAHLVEQLQNVITNSEKANNFRSPLDDQQLLGHIVAASRQATVPLWLLFGQARFETTFGDPSNITTRDGVFFTGGSKGNAHNLFNIRPGNSWTGKVVVSPEDGSFRAYNSYDDCVADYLRLITSSLYKGKTLEEFINTYFPASQNGAARVRSYMDSIIQLAATLGSTVNQSVVPVP